MLTGLNLYDQEPQYDTVIGTNEARSFINHKLQRQDLIIAFLQVWRGCPECVIRPTAAPSTKAATLSPSTSSPTKWGISENTVDLIT